MKTRVAVAISGSGRTLENLCLQQDNYHYEIGAVISSSPNCKGNDLADRFNIPILITDFSPHNKASASSLVKDFLETHNIHWIALGGFLKPFPILERWNLKTINIHPSLLPKYGGKGMYGKNVHKAVLDNGETISGATIHFVSEKYDDGQIIAQAEVNITDATSADDIAKKVFEAEKILYPKTLDYLVAHQPHDFPISISLDAQ